MNYELTIALVLGWLLDFVFGDPERLPHPVLGMGRWIAFWEKLLNKGPHRKARGALLVVISLLLCFGLTYALAHYPLSIVHYPLSIVSLIVSTLLVFFCLAGRTLRREVRMVFEALDVSLDDGRRQVARIVGRNTQALSAQEVRTAALETLAENLSDGVVAPLFWLCLLGIPGMVTYKFINTFDSMIGYRNTRYKDFGCWAARIDDVANFIPARITALLMLLVGKIIGQQVNKNTRLLRFVLHYGPQHASPNSGWPEAALAALLDCRFGGTHAYFGEEVYKPYIGTNPRQLFTRDMCISIRICLATEILTVCLVVTALLVLHLPFF
ncbi:MAG: cobalamin biosynthesis protein CobD [Bacteroidaceae bacterium]|nr:cobalamin biosynthesis protein CobD [Bacteroidaceae bacterium]